MKKLLMSSIVLFLFSASVLMFHVSCEDNLEAQSNTKSAINSGTVIYMKTSDYPNVRDLWKMNFDGSQKTKINIILPQGMLLTDAKISKDGNTLIFTAWNSDFSKGEIYSCDIDGSNVKSLESGKLSSKDALSLFDAY